MDTTDIEGVLAHYDLGTPDEAVPLDCDPGRPWKVLTSAGAFVVKECLLNRAAGDLRFEHGLCDWLAERGLPVARAVPARDGRTWVEREGRTFAVYQHLPGEPRRPRDAAQAGAAGRCLAAFHRLAGAFPGAPERRPPEPYRLPADDIAAVRRRWPERPEVERLCRTFVELDGELRRAGLSEGLLVNDLTPGNVVFSAERVAGVFDLECAFWGPVLTDLAGTAGAFAFVERGVAGYEAEGVLPRRERRLLPLALAGTARRWALFDLVETQRPPAWSGPEWEHSRRQVELIDRHSEALT
jgi:Ser/Thr protein kinase RdoA (MazF antagonist)